MSLDIAPHISGAGADRPSAWSRVEADLGSLSLTAFAHAGAQPIARCHGDSASTCIVRWPGTELLPGASTNTRRFWRTTARPATTTKFLGSASGPGMRCAFIPTSGLWRITSRPSRPLAMSPRPASG